MRWYKSDIETLKMAYKDARQIIDVSKVIVEEYKCKASVLQIIAHADNAPQLTKDASETGLLSLT